MKINKVITQSHSRRQNRPVNFIRTRVSRFNGYLNLPSVEKEEKKDL